MQKILYLGEEYALTRIIDPETGPAITFFTDRFYITVPDNSSEKMLQLLEKWYRNQAREYITGRVKHFSQKLKLNCNRICIKGQKTRWGSCSSLKNLNFNWLLIMAPAAVIDYVVIHELSHLVEMNHSRKFWQLVESHCPDYQQHRKWLREKGPRLLEITTTPSRGGLIV